MAAPWQVGCAGKRSKQHLNTLPSIPRESSRGPGSGCEMCALWVSEERGLLGRCEMGRGKEESTIGSLGTVIVTIYNLILLSRHLGKGT